MTDQIGVLRRHSTLQDQTLLDQLSASRSQLATLQISNSEPLTPESRRATVARLTAEVGCLEGEVSRRSTEFRAWALPVTLDAVRKAIPADAALVEIFSYEPFNAKAKNEAEKLSASRYVAYVGRRDGTVPQWVELGDASQIDKDATSWRIAEGLPPLRKKGEQISDAEMQTRIAKHDAEVKAMTRALDEHVMRPIRALLGQTHRIIISPDGALNLIPFAALVDENGKYLIENYSLTYLTSGRDLLRLQVQTESPGALVVIANPLYDLSAASRQRLVDGQANQHANKTDANRRSTDFALMSYNPLPGTAEEAAELAKLLPQGTEVLLQEQATKAALKQVSHTRVLHIATHGFFLPDQAQVLRVGTWGLRGTFGTLDTSPMPASWENPLLRSGLVLADVKQGHSGIGEDGILTALEVAGLDLWGTKLVVLSACETALGDVKNGEGVYVLRRALVLAGSETPVISLWKVSETGTRDLMVAYYKRLQSGEGRTEALRQVQLAMLRRQMKPTTATPRSRRETKDIMDGASKDYRHPYYWASFISSGDWRNMNGKEARPQ